MCLVPSQLFKRIWTIQKKNLEQYQDLSEVCCADTDFGLLFSFLFVGN